MRFGRKRDPQPVPPENVRVVVGEREIPVECVYRGRLDCGCAWWVGAMPIGIGTERMVRLRIDRLPARTEVGIEMIAERP